MDALYETVHHAKRPGAGSYAARDSDATGGAPGEKKGLSRKESVMKMLSMRNMTTSIEATGASVNAFAGGRPDHAAWDRVTPILEDAAEIMGEASEASEGAAAKDKSALRGSVVLMATPANAEVAAVQVTCHAHARRTARLTVLLQVGTS